MDQTDGIDFVPYTFDTHPGLPPDGEPGQFFGFDAAGYAYMLRWRDDSRGPRAWAAVGFDPAPYLKPATPVVFLCYEDNAGRILKWARAPLAMGE